MDQNNQNQSSTGPQDSAGFGNLRKDCTTFGGVPHDAERGGDNGMAEGDDIVLIPGTKIQAALTACLSRLTAAIGRGDQRAS